MQRVSSVQEYSWLQWCIANWSCISDLKRSVFNSYIRVGRRHNCKDFPLTLRSRVPSPPGPCVPFMFMCVFCSFNQCEDTCSGHAIDSLAVYILSLQSTETFKKGFFRLTEGYSNLSLHLHMYLCSVPKNEIMTHFGLNGCVSLLQLLSILSLPWLWVRSLGLHVCMASSFLLEPMVVCLYVACDELVTHHSAWVDEWMWMLKRVRKVIFSESCAHFMVKRMILRCLYLMLLQFYSLF